MSTIRVCDRCGKKIDIYSSIDHAVEIRYDSMSHVLDLCDDCKKVFIPYIMDFLNRKHTNDEVKEWSDGKTYKEG